MSDRLSEFRAFRERMNTRILEAGNLEIKRFFALDTLCYEAGAVDMLDRLNAGQGPESTGHAEHHA